MTPRMFYTWVIVAALALGPTGCAGPGASPPQRAPGEARTLPVSLTDEAQCHELGRGDRSQDDAAGVTLKEVNLKLEGGAAGVRCGEAYIDGYKGVPRGPR